LTTAALQTPAIPVSWLARLDPRPKLAYALFGIALCMISGRIEIMAAILIVAHGVVLFGGVPIRQVLGLWRGLVILLGIVLIGQTVFNPSGDVLARLGPAVITTGGLTLAVRQTLRIAAAALIAATPLWTTPINVLVRGLEKLGLPYAWGMAVGLALRYLQTIGDLYRSISEAQQARGWDPSSGGLIARAKATVPTLIALIIASLRLSDSLALGMAARGFGLNRHRTMRADIEMRGVDWVAVGMVMVGFAGGMVANLSL
jgi:energy-coupling factor transport system permease protein